MSTLERKTPKASFGFPRKARITRGAELQRIAREGKRIRTRYIEVRAAASPLAYSKRIWLGVRVGLVIPRFKHSAVMRNQLKRRLRELARVQLVPLMIRVDVVMRIRPDAYDATFTALAKDIARVLEQLEQWGVASQESSFISEPTIETPRKTS